MSEVVVAKERKPTASCPLCFGELSDKAKAKAEEKRMDRVKAFSDLCNKHQKKLRKEFGDDYGLLVETVNSLGAAVNPLASIFFPSLRFLVDEKKKRDLDWITKKKEADEYILRLKENMERVRVLREAQEEKRRQERIANGLPAEEEPVVKKERVKREPKTSSTKKLSEMAQTIGMDNGEMLPSELMAIVSGDINDADGVQETILVPEQANVVGKKRRGRPPKQR
jgi:hypothetical protein